VAVTAKAASFPTDTVSLVGWLMITGGELVTVMVTVATVTIIVAQVLPPLGVPLTCAL
jgi:hypothetical protein